MNQSEFQRARYYRVTAKDWPIEKYLLCESAREAAEEFAALFDLGDLFDRVEITVSLSDARGKWRSQQFTVRSSHMRVYEAVQCVDLSEPEPEEILEFEELGEIRDVDLDEPVAAEEQPAQAEQEPEFVPAPDDAEIPPDEARTVLRLVESCDDDPDGPDDEPDDSSSSGLRRLAGFASRGYGRIVRGLFGRRRGRAA